jgi:hypothetical protein
MNQIIRNHIPGFVLTIGALIFILGCIPEPPRLKCTSELQKFENIIKEEFKADSVRIKSIVLKEEIYFPTLISPLVSIYNPETETLNFKSLSENEYSRFENFQEIEESLKVEAEPIARMISESCEMGKFNDLLIEFAKTNNREKYQYRFISHFEYLAN